MNSGLLPGERVATLAQELRGNLESFVSNHRGYAKEMRPGGVTEFLVLEIAKLIEKNEELSRRVQDLEDWIRGD